MKKQTEKSYWLAMLIAGIAVVLFSTAAIARMLGWGSSSTGNAGDISGLEVPEVNEKGVGPRCPECGMIVSTSGGEIIVRMANGSSRVIDNTNPARWRAGERLIFIAGTGPLLP